MTTVIPMIRNVPLDPVPAVATVNRQAAPMITVVAMLSFVAVKKNASLHQQVETKEHHRLQQTSAQAIVAPATPHSSRMPTPLIVVPTHKETAASIPNAVTILVIVPSTTIALSMEINNYDQTLQTFNALAEVENKQIVAKRQEPLLQASAVATPITTKMLNVKLDSH